MAIVAQCDTYLLKMSERLRFPFRDNEKRHFRFQPSFGALRASFPCSFTYSEGGGVTYILYSQTQTDKKWDSNQIHTIQKC